jgi:predicted MFS family arabinose efflux permease
MVLPFLVLYLTEGLGFDKDDAGMILAIYGAGAIAAAPAAGWLSDRIGPLRLMTAALFVSGALLLVLPVAGSFAAVAAAVFAWAFTAEAFRPASLAVMTDVVEADQRKAGYALQRLAINLGMSVGPVVGGFLATISFVFLFLVDGATSIVAGLLLLVAFRSGRVAHATQSSPSPEESSRWGALTDRKMLVFLAGSFPIAVVFFQNMAAMPLYIVQGLGYSEGAFGLLLAINPVMIVFLEVPLNLATAEWPHARTMVLGALLTAAGFGGLAFATGPLAIVATVAVWTFGEMLLFPSMAAYVAEIAPAARRGVYMGLYTFMWSVAFALGPWLGTVVLERASATALWIACFACGALSAALFALDGRGQRDE